MTRLLAWAEPFEKRTWAIESAGGLGSLDVPATLASRIRLLGSGRTNKNDPNDARSAAIVALRNATLNTVTGEHEDRVILRLLADRYHQLTAQRTRTVCRLHAVLCPSRG